MRAVPGVVAVVLVSATVCVRKKIVYICDGLVDRLRLDLLVSYSR